MFAAGYRSTWQFLAQRFGVDDRPGFDRAHGLGNSGANDGVGILVSSQGRQRLFGNSSHSPDAFGGQIANQRLFIFQQRKDRGKASWAAGPNCASWCNA